MKHDRLLPYSYEMTQKNEKAGTAHEEGVTPQRSQRIVSTQRSPAPQHFGAELLLMSNTSGRCASGSLPDRPTASLKTGWAAGRTAAPRPGRNTGWRSRYTP